MKRTTNPRTTALGVVTGVIALLLGVPGGGAFAAQDPDAPLDDACWSETFVEDFDELSLYDPDTGEGTWKPGYIWPSDVIINEELQYYVDPRVYRENPFSIEDGVLAIEARRTPAVLKEQVGGAEWISGVLTTEKSFSQKYGRFEIVARPPAGKGLWAAFWLLPSFDSWPQGVAVLPEIDVMEFLGDAPNTFHTTLHTNQGGGLESYPYDHTGRERLSDDFHRYSVVWTPERVYWYLDREQVASHPTPDDFTRPVHFLVNLAVGGTWPGSPDDDTVFPARYLVDGIKAFEPRESCRAP